MKRYLYFLLSVLSAFISCDALPAFAQTTGLGGRTYTQIKTDLSLNLVENTAISTWAGSANITTLGTISTGVWNGTIITSGYGGTGNGFTKFSGPTTSEKTFTLPNASATILTDNALVTVAQGGTGAGSFTAYAPVLAGTTSTGAFQSASTGLSTAGWVLTSNGSSAAPSFQAPSGGYTYSTITADQTATAGNFYFTNKTSTRCVVTLPTSPTIGQHVALCVDPTQNTGWKLAQPATTKIYWGSLVTTAGTGGYIQSTGSGDAVDVVFQKNDGTNNLWYVVSAAGNLTVN
ncbi:MAG: hypothetical protein JSS75_07100 [Bacteroidetes bacterium]|nr:hypothetical protein [Bacteroidota bacterium]